jgi:hypothetical protein
LECFYFRFKGVFGDDVGAWVDAALFTFVTATELDANIKLTSPNLRKTLVITISGILEHKTIL